VKKLLLILLSITLVFSLVGCGSNEAQEADSSKDSNEKVEKISKEDLDQLYADPDKFKGKEVELYAKIFVPVERDGDATYIQAFGDPVNSDKNTIIAIKDPKIDLKEGDIIRVIGKVKGSFDGENAFGGSITAPTIIADSIEKTDYATAFAPAIKTVEVNEEKDQHGCKLKIDKVEIAEDETRVYVKLNNGTDNKIDFYSFNTLIIQGDKQYEAEENYETGYPEPQSEISPGVSTEGIIRFPKIDLEGKQAKIVSEVYSDNYNINMEPFTFEITWD